MPRVVPCSRGRLSSHGLGFGTTLFATRAGGCGGCRSDRQMSGLGIEDMQVHASVYVGRKIVGLTEKDIDVIVAYIVSRDISYVAR